MKTLFQITIASLFVAACGGNSGPEFGPVTAPTQAQQAAITSAEANLLSVAAVDVDGPDAGIAAISLGATATLLIAPDSAAGSAPGSARIAHADPGMAVALAALQRASLGDCEVISGNSIVWNQCTNNGTTIDGMISWSTGHVDMHLHLSATSPSETADETISGSMTVSASGIQGDMTFAVSASSGSNHISESLRWQIDVQIAQGCITSGTLTATASGSGVGAINGGVQVIWTGCHAFSVRNA